MTIGWQWSAPNAVDHLGHARDDVVAVTIGAACVALAVRVSRWAVPALVVLRPWEIRRPLCLVGVGLAVLIVGAHHFANGWPGTGDIRGLIRASCLEELRVRLGVDAVRHVLLAAPGCFGHFPGTRGGVDAGEPDWPWQAVVLGVAKLVRRLDFPDRVLRFERIVGFMAASAMGLFLTGAALWVVDGGPGPRDLFHIGSIDVIELVVLVGIAGPGRPSGQAHRECDARSCFAVSGVGGRQSTCEACATPVTTPENPGRREISACHRR